jgi:hypothetical protein|tara:strand:+ start:81 stop:272 length:192 start_codon:yes stop_codon:yes gene_type:complete
MKKLKRLGLINTISLFFNMILNGKNPIKGFRDLEIVEFDYEDLIKLSEQEILKELDVKMKNEK